MGDVQTILTGGREELGAGWRAIMREMEKIYPGQEETHLHLRPLVSWRFGGDFQLDGVSVYDGGDFWHFVTFGLTELDEKESDDPQYSGWGMEFTFKLKKGCCEQEDREILNICRVLEQLARITMYDGEVFGPNEYVSSGQTQGIDTREASALTGFICVRDQSLPEKVQTPFGEMGFLLFIGVTANELKGLSDHASVEELYRKLGSDITDLRRSSVV